MLIAPQDQCNVGEPEDEPLLLKKIEDYVERFINFCEDVEN